MTESYGSGFGFGSYVKEEPAEDLITHEMMEEPASEDLEEFVAEVPAPAPEPAVAPKTSAALVSKYEISQRPLRAKKHR
jgi:hypothetical protein